MFFNSILLLIENTSGSNNLTAQGIGMVGLIFAIISFQNNKRNLILIFLGLAQMCFIFHFALLEVWPAFAVNIVAVVRTFSFLLRGKKKWMERNTLMYVFISLFCVAGALSWNGWLSFLPVMAMTIETIGLWKKNPRLIRSIVIIPRPLWITYNAIHHSYPGVLTELFVVGSLITGIVRFDILPWVRGRKNSETKEE
ncbi:YgjV family protein [candidate division WOR-3 bacterium]|nr:YgjV family protein [candidate division WOR-3 bacterium]